MSQQPLLDTQLISYAMKGQQGVVAAGATVSSVSVQEFLLQQNPDGPGLRYGTRLLPRWPTGPRGSRLRAPFPLLTDTLRYPGHSLLLHLRDGTHQEHLHGPTARVVNTHDRDTFVAWTRDLEREMRALCRARFDWLVDNKIKCIGLTRAAASRATGLYAEFTATHTPKDRRRNTINDLLILAVAVTEQRDLLTADRFLAVFARDYLVVPISDAGPGVLVRTGDATRASGWRRDRRGSRSSHQHRRGRYGG